MARRVCGVETERSRFWRGHVDGQGRSGEGVRAYCRRHGLSEAGFYAWRRELRVRDGLRDVAASARSMFVEVTPVASTSRACPLEVVLRGDWVVRVYPGFDAETLAGVVRVLEFAAPKELGVPKKEHTC